MGIEKVIGAQIVRLRKERGLSQAQLAERIDVATETISRLERGVSIPSLKTLENISRQLHVSFEELLEAQPSRKTPAEKELTRIAALLKPMKVRDIKRAYNVLRSMFEGGKRG